MKKVIYIFIVISITTVNAFSQGYYFNIDKEQFWNSNGISENGLCNVKITYVFDWGNYQIIERNDINDNFRIYNVSNYDVDTINKKETWFIITPENDSLIVIIDFAEIESHNIILMFFEKDLFHSKRLWQHVVHFREFTKEQVTEFFDKLYK